VSGYTVSPALPAGLSLNSSTGVISGTPTAVTPMTSYTMIASNASGSAAATIVITVNDIPPQISYGAATNFTFPTQTPVHLAPANTGGAVVAWTISPALPPGLVFGATDGTITGTPSAAGVAATYTVTAQNSGGTATVSLLLGVADVLLELGHNGRISLLRLTPTRVLSQDNYANHWALWDYGTAGILAKGDLSCARPQAVPPCTPRADHAGQVLVTETASGLESRSAADGSLVATIKVSASWWALATDGSYICTGDSKGLTVWSTAGSMITARAGDYSNAVAFAAPAEVRVALGPAGTNVVEAISVPAGASSPSPAFQGQFNSWFLDGERFLTNIGNTVWTYSKAGVQQDLTSVSSVLSLTGQGAWFWTTGNVSGLNIYKVGASGTPAASYPGGADPPLASGLTILVPQRGSANMIDLSGSAPTMVTYPMPVSPTAYGAVSSSQWMVGNGWGLLLDGASVGSTPRYFGYGIAMSIAGSTQRVALATALGKVLFLNAATRSLEGTMDLPGLSGLPVSESLYPKLSLSSDGTVLAVAANLSGSSQDLSIYIYSLPSASLTYRWAYPTPYPSPQYPVDMTLSGSGTVLGQVIQQCGVAPSCSASRQVTAPTAGAVIWSDSSQSGQPIRLSPDGTLIAASSAQDSTDGGRNGTAGTNIYRNGTLVTAVPGWPVGWVDNNRILVNSYSGTGAGAYKGSALYDSSGVQLATPSLPELGQNGGEIQSAGADSVYDVFWNSIFSVKTGTPTWVSAPGSGVGAAAGSRIVFVSGNQVFSQPY
jgi:hypothetical protein